MVELSNERMEQILHKETAKKEELTTILRGIYTRYMLLYEKYFADIDALNDDEVTALKNYHEETNIGHSCRRHGKPLRRNETD